MYIKKIFSVLTVNFSMLGILMMIIGVCWNDRRKLRRDRGIIHL